MLRFTPGFQRDTFDAYDLFHGHKLFFLLWSPDVTPDFVSGANALFLEDRRRHVNIFGARREIVTFPAKKPVALAGDFQHSFADQLDSSARVGLEQIENQLMPGTLVRDAKVKLPGQLQQNGVGKLDAACLAQEQSRFR